MLIQKAKSGVKHENSQVIPFILPRDRTPTGPPIYEDSEGEFVFLDHDLLAFFNEKLSLEETGFLMREINRAVLSKRPSKRQKLLLAMMCLRHPNEEEA